MAEPAIWPNLFVAGAPKCGTTAVWRYLGRHPQVFMSRRKDLHYFGRDLKFRTPRPDTATYLRHFSGSSWARVRGDVGVWMLYSKTAAREIADRAPGARAVVCLREPVAAMQALHAQLLLNGLGDEDIGDFSAAVAAIGERRRGLRLPPRTALPAALDYIEVYRLAPQVRRFQEALGPSNVHCILLDDWEADARATYRRLLAFLRVDAEFETDLPRVNCRRATRSEAVRDLVRATPAWAKDAVPLPLRRLLSRGLRRLNSRRVRARPVGEPLRTRLWGELAEDVQELEHLIGRDLGTWRARHAAG